MPIEKMRNKLKGEPPVYRMSLKDRAVSVEQQHLLEELQEEAQAIEQELFQAFPHSVPNEMLKEMIKNTPRVRDRLLSLANKARAFGRHYKGYHVGAAILGIREKKGINDNPFVVVFNANTKINKVGWARSADDIKYCAEQYAIDEARKRGVKEILSFDIVAIPRPKATDPTGFYDEDSDKTQITLTPCAACRERMEKISEESDEGPAIVTPETEIATADARHSQSYYAGDLELERFSYQKLMPLKSLSEFHTKPLRPNMQEIDDNNGNGS